MNKQIEINNPIIKEATHNYDNCLYIYIHILYMEEKH